VKEYIINGTPLEQTIRRCDDIRKFVTVRAVQGGGEWVKGEQPDMKSTVAQKRARVEAFGWKPDLTIKKHWTKGDFDSMAYTSVPLDTAYATCFKVVEREYLGKAVRWYYGVGQTGHIAYEGNGNLVSKSEGCKPCMDLPDVLPPDINYKWYVDEARSILADLGISC